MQKIEGMEVMDGREAINMNDIVGRAHILFICIDCLRYDVAKQEEESGGTPVLNRYGSWRECQAPGNFTYPSHQAMFAGFLPIDTGIRDMKQRETLFFSEDIGMGRKAPEGALRFSRPTWIQELSDRGYGTYCIGGVSFFDKRTELGSVLPGYFDYSFWRPSFGCQVRESAKNQVDFALRILSGVPEGQKIMMYINFTALHYPNYFYLDEPGMPGQENGAGHALQRTKRDTVESQRMALRYVDGELERLLQAFSEQGESFVICLGDHGTCYGEDGVWYHGVNHPIVNTVPYKHFLL